MRISIENRPSLIFTPPHLQTTTLRITNLIGIVEEFETDSSHKYTDCDNDGSNGARVIDRDEDSSMVSQASPHTSTNDKDAADHEQGDGYVERHTRLTEPDG